MFTTDGQFLRIFGNVTETTLNLEQPVGIYYTFDNHLLISSNGNHCVMVFEEDGRFVSVIEGTYQGKERFRYPCGIIMMNSGQIIIACADNNLIVF